MSQSSVIPSGWVPLSEAVQKLGRSAKTIERLVANGELASRLIPMEGRKPQRVFSADSIKALRERINKRAERAPLLTPQPRLPVVHRSELALPENAIDELNDVVTRWLNRPTPPISISQKLWLTLDEAAELSGLPRSAVADFAAEGRITAMKRGAWFVNRASLEAFAG